MKKLRPEIFASKTGYAPGDMGSGACT